MISYVITKGENKLKEEFSGFSNPKLKEYLINNQIKRVFVCGVAYDYCVGYTALDSVIDFDTFVIKDASKSISNDSECEMSKMLIESKVKLIELIDLDKIDFY